MQFEKISSQTDFAKMEESILEFWEKNHIFRRSVEEKDEANRYFFYDGPPFATGLPHYGHILAGTIKDVIPRYQTMLGKKVERRFGWDCHGLPIEFEAEKELGLKGKQDIEKMGIAKFNEYCRSIVLRYTEEWKKNVKRMGRWADLENPYKTMDLNFMESIWWVFKRLWEKKLIYQGSKILAYSTRLHTPLSNFEVNLGYKNVQDPSIVVAFQKLAHKNEHCENEYFLAWTTTPWTIPSNLALSVHPKIRYAKVASKEKFYYLAESLVPKYFKENFEIKATMLGAELLGEKYKPVFPYFEKYRTQNAFQIFDGDFVSEESGTGIVHCAPMFGEDDFEIGKKHNLPEVLPLNSSGYFDETVSAKKLNLQGLYFKDADKPIMTALKKAGFLFHQSTIEHSYPFCWRSDTPLIYRAIPSWFVAVTEFKETMLKNNQSVHWKPEHIKNGRMGKWLESAKDWSISRNRYWGTPIPVWICEFCGEKECLGSRQELEEKTGKKITDLHRHFIDDLTFPCPKCQKIMRRTSEVLDCWFESGSMPYGQEHYPYENKEKFDKAFPADFISEGLDQTRGWFYTLIVLSNALFGKCAFKNIIVSGLLLAEDGKKMSKSLKNYPDPNLLIAKYGADAIRLYLLNCAAVKAEEYCFSEALLKETAKNYLIPLWNVYVFYKTYSEIDNFTPQKLLDFDTFIKTSDENIEIEEIPTDKNELKNILHKDIDRWIVSKLHSLIKQVRETMDDYDINRAVQPFLVFIDQLTNWYIRCNRRRFWKANSDLEYYENKEQAYFCLYEVLRKLCLVLAPFIPFLTEKIYFNIRRQDLDEKRSPISVHLCEFPKPNENWIDEKLNDEMDKIIQIVSLGRQLRAQSEIRLRQPLPKITLVSSEKNLKKLVQSMSELICEELNVKEVAFLENEEKLVKLSARPNLPLLGPRYGKHMKQVSHAIKNISSVELFEIYKGNTYSFSVEEESFSLNKEDLIFDRQSSGDNLLIESYQNITVVLDVELDEKLLQEGLIRDFIRQVQQKRKDTGLEVTDRISIEFVKNKLLSTAIRSFEDYLKQETLSEKITELETESKDKNLQPIIIGEEEYYFGISKLDF